jgi:hypothetical protein
MKGGFSFEHVSMNMRKILLVEIKNKWSEPSVSLESSRLSKEDFVLLSYVLMR